MTHDKKTSILAIDDETSILRSLEGILDNEGYKVFVAESGSEGLSIIMRQEIDIVLLDVWMPGRDGIETLEEIKEEHPEIKVILISGHATKDIAAKALDLGASDFIEKPISADNLLDSIQGVEEKVETKVFRVEAGRHIPCYFYETVCIYPENKDLLFYLRKFCSERFFVVVVAQIWTDVIATPNFETIIDPSAVNEEDWSTLFGYLDQVPYIHERYILSSRSNQPIIPEGLNGFFKTIEDRSALGEYILRCNKRVARRMSIEQRSYFVEQRRNDVKKLLNKKDMQREFLIERWAKYYNVSIRTIQRDLSSVT